MSHQHHTVLHSGLHHVIRAANQSPPAAALAAMPQVNAAALAKQVVAAYNSLYANDFNLAMLLGVAAFFLAIAPVLATWFSTGRFTQGWFLGGKKRGKPEEEWGISRGMHRVVSMEGVVIPASIKVVSGWYANWRWTYNKVLLPSVPVFNLTVGQVLVCVGYEALVLLFLFIQSGSFVTNYKRPGYISVAQIPAVFLLATKNSLVSILGKGYEKLNFLHRVAGRMMILCGAIHTIYFFKDQAGKPVDFTDTTIYSGTVAIVAFGLILLTSVSFFRRTCYQVFVFSHVIGWLTFIIAVNIHVPAVAGTYTYVGVGGLLLDFVVRIASTRFKTAKLMPLSGGMTMIQVHGVAEGWRSGQHVWIRVLKGRRMGETHPFTIANSPASASPLPGQHNLTILAKSTGDWTRSLLEMANTAPDKGAEKESFGFGRTCPVAIEGPYGGPMFTDFSESQSVILFAGGSGISFAASVLEEIVGQAIDGTCRTRNVTLVWTMKALECVDWYQEMFNALVALATNRAALNIRMKLYVTGPARSDYCPIANASVIPSRPDIDSLVEAAVEDVLTDLASKTYECVRGGGVAVGTCGPDQLVRAVRKAVSGVTRARAVKAGGIVAHSECFGW